jgi:hypothetical protein
LQKRETKIPCQSFDFRPAARQEKQRHSLKPKHISHTSSMFSPLSSKVFRFDEAMTQLDNNFSNNLLARNLSSLNKIVVKE